MMEKFQSVKLLILAHLLSSVRSITIALNSQSISILLNARMEIASAEIPLWDLQLVVINAAVMPPTQSSMKAQLLSVNSLLSSV
jgi:hypothetical protein